MEDLATIFIASFIATIIFIYGLSKYGKINNTKSGNITRLDDKNWIVNNEFVSLEEDTPLLRMKQKREDNKHYRDYEQRVLSYERQIISDEWIRTKGFIAKHKGILKKVTIADIEQYIEKYTEYLSRCEKLKEDKVLTVEEFIIDRKSVV